MLRPLIAGREAQVRVLCTDQFGITDPAAIRAMQQAGVAVRAFTGPGVYHPKVWIASRPGGPARWLAGSANLSESALRHGVEAVMTGEDGDGAALAWFDGLYAMHGAPFDAARLTTLEAAFAARMRSSVRAAATEQTAGLPGSEHSAAEAVEAAFASLPDIVVPLNADKAGNNVRTLRRIREILNDSRQLEGKALSEFKLIGLASGGGFSAVGRQARNQPEAVIARIWMTWLKAASPAEVAGANPSGRLAQARVAFDTFWAFPTEIRDFFLTHATRPENEIRPQLQTIELLANTGRRLPNLTMRDVRRLSGLLQATATLPPRVRDVVRDYLENKGTRGWSEPDRVLILEAWRDAP
ncbi:MAG: hypothetical protein V4659_08095 [Pseudomonadota bacterium]